MTHRPAQPDVQLTRWQNKDLKLLCSLLFEFGLHHHWRSFDGQTEKVVERDLILLFLFLSLCRLCVCIFLCSHWSLVDVPLIFFCPADHVPDWQPRVLLGMVEARSVNVKKTTTVSYTYDGVFLYQIYSQPLYTRPHNKSIFHQYTEQVTSKRMQSNGGER